MVGDKTLRPEDLLGSAFMSVADLVDCRQSAKKETVAIGDAVKSVASSSLSSSIDYELTHLSCRSMQQRLQKHNASLTISYRFV